jgi:hypothetical protein
LNALAWTQLALAILKGVTSQTSNQVDDEVADGLATAVNALEKVHGTDVTKAQLEAARVESLW